MRLPTITLVTLFCLALAPTAEAGKGKGKKGQHGNQGQGGGGGGGGGGGHKTKFEGAGQRLHFSFGGKLTLHQNGTLTGKFAIVAHPLAPANTQRLVVSCGYGEFSNATIAGPRLEFDAKGNCKVLELDGDITKIEVNNHIVIVDVPSGSDQIDVEFIGESGIMIPGGNLDFGNFTMTQT